MQISFIYSWFRLNAHTICPNFSSNAHTLCPNFGLNAHMLCANFGLNAHTLCANFSLNAHILCAYFGLNAQMDQCGQLDQGDQSGTSIISEQGILWDRKPVSRTFKNKKCIIQFFFLTRSKKIPDYVHLR